MSFYDIPASPQGVQATPVAAARPQSNPSPTPVPDPEPKAEVEAPATPRAEAPPSHEPETRLEAGDRLDVAVHGHPEFSGLWTVRDDGHVALPAVGDLVPAAGATVQQMAARVAATLHPRYLRTTPRISVVLALSPQRSVQILGAVAKPGRYAIVSGQTTAAEACLAAGGAKGLGLKHLDDDIDRQPVRAAAGLSDDAPAVTRRTDEHQPATDSIIVLPPDGRVQRFALSAAMAGRQRPPDLPPGTTLYVPSVKELRNAHSLGSRLLRLAEESPARQTGGAGD